jgi:S1-C subfamily serine protease
MMLYRFLLLPALLAVSFFVNAKTLDELLPNERNTIEVFQKASPNVVYVHRLKTVMNLSYERFQVPAGSGSGILWDKKGYVVTNYHVIQGAENLAVSIGEMTVKAHVVGAEPRKDIAVLAITSKKALSKLNKITPFEIANTNNLLVGQKAIAIGNPFGLDHTLTTGVISALGRRVPGIGGVTIRDMIQTDASINPGNSGGPLLDSSGKLIGMNTVIYSQSGNSAGIGFAVPADDISRIVGQILRNGRVVLAGIGVARVEKNIARRLGVRKGVLIAESIKNTPAHKAGLRGTYRDRWGRVRLGDVILAVNGHPIKDYDDLYNILAELKVGETVTLTILRDNKKIKVKIKTIDIAAY